MYITSEAVRDYSTGDVVKIAGKKYRLLKKTTTACAVVRYYWIDSVVDWLGRKFGSES